MKKTMVVYILSALVIFSALIQGGFYPSVFLSAGILLGITGIVLNNIKISIMEAVLWGFSGIYLMASLVNGYDSSSLAQACLPLISACFIHCYLAVSIPQRKKMISILISFSMCFALIGLAALCGALTIEGAVTAKRLQFPFQYANAAGSWYGAMALLLQEKRKVSQGILPIITAMLLTRSVGAILLYLLCLCVALYKERPDNHWQETVFVHTAAMLFAGTFYYVNGIFAWGLLATLILCDWKISLITDCARRIYLYWPCLLCTVIGICYAFFSKRMSSAFGTLAERLIQIHDGGKMILQFPFFGIGAGNWQYLYGKVQTAQYRSTVIHSSIIQCGVDAGIAAMALGTVFVILFWIRKNDFRVNLVVTFLYLHSLLDFTMQFFPIAVCFLMLLFLYEEPESKAAFTVNFRGILIVCSFLFCFLFATEQMSKRLNNAAIAGAWPVVLERYENWESLLGRNRNARTPYLYALYESGDFNSMLVRTNHTETLSEQEILLRARAIREQGNEKGACAFLLNELQNRLYRLSLFESVSQLFIVWNAPPEIRERYNEIVRISNESCSLLGNWTGSQVKIDFIQ